MAIKDYVTVDINNNYILHIAVNEVHNGVMIESITQCISTQQQEDGSVDCGDLAVNWNANGLSDAGMAAQHSTLLMRNPQCNDDVTKVMGSFYWEHAYDKKLRSKLVAAGFTKRAAQHVSGSEWGMQDVERASYDAYEVAKEVFAAMQS